VLPPDRDYPPRDADAKPLAAPEMEQAGSRPRNPACLPPPLLAPEELPQVIAPALHR